MPFPLYEGKWCFIAYQFGLKYIGKNEFFLKKYQKRFLKPGFIVVNVQFDIVSDGNLNDGNLNDGNINDGNI